MTKSHETGTSALAEIADALRSLDHEHELKVDASNNDTLLALRSAVSRLDKAEKPGFDGTAIIMSLGAFTFGTFTIVETIAHWVFGTDTTLLGLPVAAAFGLLLTGIFRDRMRLTTRDIR